MKTAAPSAILPGRHSAIMAQAIQPHRAEPCAREWHPPKSAQEFLQETRCVAVCHPVRLVSDLLAFLIETQVPMVEVSQLRNVDELSAALSSGKPIHFVLWSAERVCDSLIRDIDGVRQLNPQLRIALLVADPMPAPRQIRALHRVSVIAAGTTTGLQLIAAIRTSLSTAPLDRPAPAAIAAAIPTLDTGRIFGSAPLGRKVSPRQVEVLALLARGHSNKSISGTLGLSESTVKSHVKAIMRTLKARNRTEAALIGLGAMPCAADLAAP